MKKAMNSEFSKFLVLRLGSFLGNMLLIYLLIDLGGINKELSYLFSLLFFLLLSYVISAIWVFEGKHSWIKFGRYLIFIGLVSLATVPLFSWLDKILDQMHLLAAALSLATGVILKFVVQKMFVFKTNTNTDQL